MYSVLKKQFFKTSWTNTEAFYIEQSHYTFPALCLTSFRHRVLDRTYDTVKCLVFNFDLVLSGFGTRILKFFFFLHV